MLTDTRRPPSEEEIGPYRSQLADADSKLSNAKKSAKMARPFLWIACLILAILVVVGYLIVSPGLLAGSLAMFLVALYFAVTTLFSKPEDQWRLLERQRDDLRALVERGEYVVTHVTSSRCFVVQPFADESPEFYFDLGEQGTLLIYAFGIDDGWTPNTDFTLSSLGAPGGSRRFEE